MPRSCKGEVENLDDLLHQGADGCRMSDVGALDDIDRRLVSVLAREGRISVNELANRANVSRATAYSRFERLTSSGAIKGFRAEVDPAALGYTVAALILLNVAQQHWREVPKKLLALPGVEWVAFTSGPFDMVLLVRAPDIAALRDVVLVKLHGMAEVKSSETIFILDEASQPLP